MCVCVWVSVCVSDSLLHPKERKQREVGLFVESQDTLPVHIILLLFIQCVESEERRIETRQKNRQQKSRAAHHTPETRRQHTLVTSLHLPTSHLPIIHRTYPGLGDSSCFPALLGPVFSFLGSASDPPSSGRSGKRNLNANTQINLHGSMGTKYPPSTVMRTIALT